MKFSIVGAALGLGLIVGLSVLLCRSIPAQNASPGTLGTISGRVTLDDGRPAVGYSIVAWSTQYVTPAPAAEAVTDAEGRYRLAIDTGLSPRVFQSVPPPPGDTRFAVTVQGQEPLYLMPPNRTVTLPAALILRDINFRLTAGPQITVRVHDAMTGQPVPGVTAKYLWTMDPGNDYLTGGVTDAQGQAIFRVPKLDVRLNLVPPGGATPTVKAAPGGELYRELTLPQVKDVVWDVQTYPTTPPATPSVWCGVVLAQDGRPAAYAKVSVLRSGAEFATVTGKQGRFAVSLPPLTPEQYNDRFQGVALLAQKGDQNALLVPPFEAPWTGITVRLVRKPLASYAGTVVGPDGRPEVGVSVSCRGGLEAAPNSGAGVNRFGVTDARGHFRLAGLPAGRYQVSLGGGLFGSITLPPSDPGYPYSNTLLTLRDGEQHDLGRLTVLPADEVLAGQIVDHDGKPVTAGLTAIIHGAHISQTVSLDSLGQFRAYHIVREPLTLDLYRADTDGSTRLGQDSPDLFRKVPVRAGQEDVHVVLPAGTLRLPAAAPLPPPAPLPSPAPPVAPAGPPQVSASSGSQQIAGLVLVYYQENAAPDPQQAHLHAVLYKLPWTPGAEGIAWQGSMAAMEGMRLVVKNRNGVLKDQAGHTLWTGPVQQPQEIQPSYTVITDNAKPNFLTLRDPEGRTLWSGLAASKVPPVVFVDQYIAVVGPKGRIVWQQRAVTNSLTTQMAAPRKEPDWAGSWLHGDGVVHFAAAPRRAVFQTGDGQIIYSGPLLTLTLTVTGDRKDARAGESQAQRPCIILPFSVGNSRAAVTCTLYDAQGRTIQRSTSKPAP